METQKLKNYVNSEFANNSVVWKDKFEEVKKILASYNLFSQDLIDSNTDFYFNKLGFNKDHFKETSSYIISKIIVCIITARINEKYSSDKYFPIFEEKHDNFIFIISKVYAEDNKTRLNFKMERKIEEKYFNFSDMNKDCYKLKSFRSVHSLFDLEESYNEPLRTYILELPVYKDDSIVQEREINLGKLMDVNFYESIKNTEKERIYEDLNNAVLHDLTGQFIQVHYEETSDTTFNLNIAVKRSNVISNFFSLVGDCLNMHRCFSSSKFVEPLKNGVLIMILNVQIIVTSSNDTTNSKKEPTSVKEKIHKVINSLKTLCLFHNPMFIQLSVKRMFTPQECAYIYILMKFITFFSTNAYANYKNVEHALHLESGRNSSVLSDFYIIKEKLKSSKYTEADILNCVQSNANIVKKLFKNFERKFKYAKGNGNQPKSNQSSSSKSQLNGNRFYNNPFENPCYNSSYSKEDSTSSKQIIDEIENNYHKKILQYFYTFEKYVTKTNFFLIHKISFAVAFDGSLLKESIYESQPYSIIMVLGLSFVGFHIRFSKISRGGVRIVISNNINSFNHNYENLFDEAYNLAYTQNFKNKDIPEGGSKGIILLKADTYNKSNVKYIKNLCFYSYVNSLLDLLTSSTDTTITQGANKDEEEKGTSEQLTTELLEDDDNDLIFLGPDENTGCDKLMDWGAIMAKERKYKFWKTFTTGKLRKNGGVPHDYYGMTTLGIETYIRKLCEKLNLKEENISRSVVGGPDGDLGSNCIFQSKTKIMSIIDGSGVLYDKQGLNKKELIRLAKRKKFGIPQKKKQTEKENETNPETNSQQSNKPNTCCVMYKEKYLSKDGFKISIEESNVELFGTLIKNGLDFRNTFFLNEMNACDLFNPCGGRPHSINIFNVDNIIRNDKCIYKYIVEGANVFISDDARRILESKNVILFKDAATNKGGVISSSLEVLAGLVLDDEQYIQLMCSKDSDIVMEGDSKLNCVYRQIVNVHNKKNNAEDSSSITKTNEHEEKKTTHENKQVEESETEPEIETETEIEKEIETEEDKALSEFYKMYVQDIQNKIKEYCEMEFEALWNETRRTNVTISDAVNILSKKISELKRDILNSKTLCFDYVLMKNVLQQVIPKTLLQIVPFDEIYKRVPFSYLKSLFASCLASRYYYSQQFLSDISVFNFFEYIKKLQKEN